MNISVFIARFDPETKKGTKRSYSVPFRPGMTVLDLLMYVHQQLDPTLAFRYECRSGICGTCGLMLNGKPVLSCTTQIDGTQKKHVLEPLANFPIERDLIVNIAPVLERYKKVKPYLDKMHTATISKAKANESKPFRKCIECGCCIAGSPTVAKYGDEILDPMALVKIARYVTDPRDGVDRKAIAKRLGSFKYSEKEGKNLADMCPRGVPIDKAVSLLKE